MALISGWRGEGRRVRRARASLLDCLTEGVLVIGRGFEIHTANQAAGQILGVESDQISAMSLPAQILDDDGHTMAADDLGHHPLFRAVTSGRPVEDLRVRFLRPDGGKAWLSVNVVPMNGDNSGETVLTFTDITRQRESAQHFDQPALSDPLTGLASRVLLEDRLATALERRDNRVAVFYLDVDDLANVNCTLGHAAGDAVIQTVGRRLRRQSRPSDSVARFGGDEFVVVCDGYRDGDDARNICSRLLEELGGPIDVGGTRTRVTVSAGIALAEPGEKLPDTMVSEAERAMYHAKSRGRGRIAVYDSAMSDDAFQHVVVEQDMRQAIDDGLISCWYQPQMDLTSGRITSVEALARWEGGPPPSVFIPVAERRGVIGDLGDDILDMAVAQGARWRRTRMPDLRVWVNVSTMQLENPEFPDRVAAILWEHGLNPAGLGLEINETVLMQDAVGLRSSLEAVRAYGMGLAIDDFGTGYSSLAILRLLPVDWLKLDARLVEDVHTSRDAQAIARAIVEMAHTLDLKVCAEGVENDAQLTVLRDMGVDEAQGFHLAHPQSAPDLDRLLVGVPSPG